MKTLFFALYIAGLMSAMAQDITQQEVPPPVLATFQSTFPQVTGLKWKKKDDVYKAAFKVGKRSHDIWIDKSGSIKKHKEDFPKSQLPPAILDKIKSDFKEYQVDDADKIETDGKVLYQVDLESPSGKRKLLFTADGKIQEGKIDD